MNHSDRSLPTNEKTAEQHEAEVARAEGERLDARFDVALSRPVSRERRRRMAQLYGAMPRKSVSEERE